MTVTGPLPEHSRRASPSMRGGLRHRVFWPAAAALVAMLAAGIDLADADAIRMATAVFMIGGMPHGAFDIALLARAGVRGRAALAVAVVAYVGIAAAMAAAWLLAPLAALILFLAVAAVHFGEDWTVLDEPLLRVAAGAAVLAAAAIGHPAAVAGLFASLAGGAGGAVVARVLIAAAPVLLLVTAVGIVAAWQDGAREWAAASALAVALLILAPPVAGFALFFVFLHAPRHLEAARASLADMPAARWLAIGAAMPLAAAAGWLACVASAAPALGGDLTTASFRLLAAVALPHLLLSNTGAVRLLRAAGGVGPRLRRTRPGDRAGAGAGVRRSGAPRRPAGAAGCNS